MKIGVLGDTHDVDKKVIAAIVQEEFVPRGVQIIVHTGDIQPEHVDPYLYGGLPVICVLVKSQVFDQNFSTSPKDWRFVRPAYPQDPPKYMGRFSDPLAEQQFVEMTAFMNRQQIYSRLVPIKVHGEFKVVYCGHERSFDIFTNAQKVRDFFAEVNQVFDGVKLVLTGHTHHQFVYRHGSLTWVNPGSVIYSFNKTNEFAVIDTDKSEVVLGRLSSYEAKTSPVTVGIVSDSANVSQLDKNFWQRLRLELDERGATQLICCGDFRSEDIGRSEFDGMDVHYYLLPGVSDRIDKPANWHLLPPEKPIVEICGHQFYVQEGIGPEQADFSEIQRHAAFAEIVKANKRLDFIVAGLVPDTILQETDQYVFINPGDARDHKYFATVCLPRREYTVGTVRS